jgi:hypothetical protein
MPETARALALFSAAFLLASCAIWTVLLRGPMLQRLDGRRASNNRPAQLAVQLLAEGFGLSAVAAVLAVAGWVSP